MAREMKAIDPTDKAAAIQAIMDYKKQNPVKFELKKDALFKKYGIEDQAEVEIPKDATDIELEEKLSKAKAKK